MYTNVHNTLCALLQTDKVQLPEGTSLIAVHAIDIGGQKKLLVEDTMNDFTTGMAIWKYCPAPLVDKDWMKPTFDDSHWQVAIAVHRFLAKPKGISGSTSWIWAKDDSMDVYFRGHARCKRSTK